MASFRHNTSITVLMAIAFMAKASSGMGHVAPTNRGTINLSSGHFTCAAPQSKDMGPDLEEFYIVCSNDHVITQPCPPGRRWDTTIDGCNFAVNCALHRKSTTTTHKVPTTTTTWHDVYATDCVNAATSEGPRTLKNGQKACAPLLSGETESDKGRRFITCVGGIVYPAQICHPALRYDTATDTCNWPDQATCYVAGGSSIGGSGTTNDPSQTTATNNSPQTTTTTTTTRRPPHTTRAPVPLPSGPCNATSCQLPDCFCYGARPAGIPVEDTPQFIMLTFDDAVTTHLYNSYYRALLDTNDFKLFNPTGCRTRSTLYVSHENTDYSKVRALYDAGNEIGSHTIHHRLPQGDKPSDYQEMVDEIQGLKDELFNALGDQQLLDSIRGFRAPYLRVAHDVMYDVLRDYSFLYDTSVLNIEILQGRQPMWPFTFDFKIGRCANPPCPTKAYPGMWEVPLNGWIGDNGQGCSMIDDCSVGTSKWTASEQQWYEMFNRNFQDYFYPIKVPAPIFTHGFLFSNYPNSYPALGRWLHDTLSNNTNIWLVTPTQVIQWMQNPLTNSEMIAQNWGC